MRISDWSSDVCSSDLAMGVAARTRMMEPGNDRDGTCLRPLVPGDRQLGDLHPLRLQLLQAANKARLALVQRLQRLPCRSVYRDVRLSSHHLLPLRLAAEPLSKHRLVLARLRASARDDLRLGGQPSFRAVPYPELRLHRCRLLADRRR